MKWTLTVIQSNGKYRAIMLMDNKEVEDLPSEVDYKTLKEAIKLKTGVTILQRKEMIFEKLSDFEKIATIDATQYRGEGKDCRVTMEDRKNGWQPDWEYHHRIY